MTDDRTREGDWDRTEWEGEGQDASRDVADSTTGARWNKQEWVGDQGEGAPVPQDPDTMPEGETGLSGDRHAPGEEHWARGQAEDERKA